MTAASTPRNSWPYPLQYSPDFGAPDQPSVTVAIPRDVVVKAPKVAALAMPERAPRIAAAAAPSAKINAEAAAFKSDSSPVAELAAARHADAVEFAMISPAAMESARPRR